MSASHSHVFCKFRILWGFFFAIKENLLLSDAHLSTYYSIKGFISKLSVSTVCLFSTQNPMQLDTYEGPVESYHFKGQKCTCIIHIYKDVCDTNNHQAERMLRCDHSHRNGPGNIFSIHQASPHFIPLGQKGEQCQTDQCAHESYGCILE